MKSIILLILFLLLFFVQCNPRVHIAKTDKTSISANNERLYLAPIINESGIELMKGWPVETYKQKALLANLVSIWKNLKTEFRRCEKFGNYLVVEDDQNPTIRISITLSQYDTIGDSIHIPVKLQIERILDGKIIIYTIPAKIFKPQQIIRPSEMYHYFGALLSDYRRNFPYKQIVSFFYTHP